MVPAVSDLPQTCLTHHPHVSAAARLGRPGPRCCFIACGYFKLPPLPHLSDHHSRAADVHLPWIITRCRETCPEWAWRKFLVTLRDVHSVPPVWSHSCEWIVCLDGLFCVSGWTVIRVEEANSRPQLTASDMKALVLFFLCAPSLLERYHPQTIFTALDISAGISTALPMHVQRPRLFSACLRVNSSSEGLFLHEPAVEPSSRV